MQIIEKFLTKEFIDKINLCGMLDGWRHWQVVYQLEVFDPNGKSRIWSIDFSDDLKLINGTMEKINLYEGIAASDLVHLIEGRTSWDYVGISGNYRTFGNIYRVGPETLEFFPNEKKFPLPLLQVFPSNIEMDREKYMKEVRLWKNKHEI